MRETRDAWIAETRAALTPPDANFVWTLYYAWPAWTPAEARDAMVALPEYSPPTFDRMVPTGEGAIGRVYWLAGDAARAIPILRKETAWCANLPARGFRPEGIDWLIARTRDSFLLGQALEQVGDASGACAEYRAVLRRWDKARPRSLTAERARSRATALACPD